MATAVFFHGMNALDFQDLRLNALRIPDVIARIRQAQRKIDRIEGRQFDLMNFIASDDGVFLANIRFKGLASAVVQVGLFDRYVKRMGLPDYMIGDVKGDSALMCCTGLVPIEELVTKSAALTPTNLEIRAVGTEPLLAGISLSELAVYGKPNDTGTSEKIPVVAGNIADAVRHLVDQYEVRRFVNIGPGSQFEQLRRDFALEDLQFVESVDLDPMLSWFWTEIPHQPVSLPL